MCLNWLRSFPATRSQSWPRRAPSSVALRIFATCFMAIAIAAHYTNYSPLIPFLKADLHVSSGEVGLFSTLLFSGLALAYIPAGILADRFGAQPVLIGSCLLCTLSGILLPLFPNLAWLLTCRIILGLGVGGAFVTGAGVASGLGKHASLGQGLYGGATQVGSGIGLLITPILQSHFGWRGSFLCWGLLGVFTIVIWLLVNDGQEMHQSAPINLKVATRSRAIWTLGLSHLGTFGLGNAIAAWITIYLATQYGLSLGLAASIGAIGLLAGMIFRPLGGILLARGVIGAMPLLQISTIIGCVGVGLLAIPLRFPPFAVVGISLIAIGSTIPYTSVFNAAARLRTAGKGVAQALVSVISSPTVIIGPPLIGFLVDRTGNFALAFGAIMLFGFVAITASFLAGRAVQAEHDLTTA